MDTDLLTPEERAVWALCEGAAAVPLYSPAEMADALTTIATLRAEVRRLNTIVADERDPDGVLDESIAACEILGIDRTGDYDYLATLRAVVKERDVAVDAFHRCRVERDEARAALAAARADGARGMLDKVREILTFGAAEADRSKAAWQEVDGVYAHHQGRGAAYRGTLTRLDALDPATVGSGS